MRRNSARAVDKLIVLAGTLCLAGDSYGLPSARFWSDVRENHPYVLIILLVAVGLFALSPVENWSTRALAGSRVNKRRQTLVLFGRMLRIAEEIQPPLPTGDLALHIWQRRRTCLHPVSGALQRTAVYRMSTQPNTRSFRPTKGVGVVGMCWRKNREVDWDATDAVSKITDETTYQAYVRHNGLDSVMGLNWRDFDDFRHRTAVFATPIRNGRSHFIGCVSVDASRGYDVLKNSPLLEEMGNLALTIGPEDFE
jgi:hypothetical protein